MTATLSFGALLRQLRKRAGMSQRDLAAALNYSDSLISKLEQAQRQPDVAAVMTHFILALGLHDDPATAALLIERAAAARGERPPDPAMLAALPRRGGAAAPDGHPGALPAAPDELIGRDEEVQRLCSRLRGHGGRLLTLVGPPGIGKTRLALAVAARLAYDYEDGAVFVPLAAITDPTAMAATTAAAVGGSETSAKPPHLRLIDVLRRKRMLLVLDNCEQIVGAAPLIADVLAACPGLCILATSRERLHLRAEQRYRVPALELAAAVELFGQRAAAVDMELTITAANRPTIEAICQRLDRLPLALELCAAQVEFFGPAQILAQLRTRPLDLLVNGARDLPPQHRTLREAIQRSYELLADDERALFRRLGSFVGGWSLDALEAVCGCEQEADGRRLVETLHALIGKSLVRAETVPTGERRFLMLETIREYALERLEDSGEVEMIRRRQAAYLLALTEQVEAASASSEQVIWLARMDVEYANLRATLQWASECGFIETGLRLATAWWWERGHGLEGRTYLEAFLPHRGNLPIALQIQALKRTGNLATIQGDYPAAQALLEESLGLARVLGDKQGIATTLDLLGFTATAWGHYHQAFQFLEESQALFEELGNMMGMGLAFLRLGVVLTLQGDYARAAAQYQKSLILGQEQGDRLLLGWAFYYLGDLAQQQGDAAQSRALLAKSLPVFQEYGDMIGIVSYLKGMAEIAGFEGRPERFVRLFGTVALLQDKFGVSLYLAEQIAHKRQLLAARAQLGEEAYDVAWAAGQVMTIEQAISYALEASDSDEGHLLADEIPGHRGSRSGL